MTRPRIVRMSDDEQEDRGFFELDNPNGRIPKKCSYCGRKNSPANPLRFDPVKRDKKSLARQYLYRSMCRYCEELGVQKSCELRTATGI